MQDRISTSRRPTWPPGDFAALATLVERDAPELESVLLFAREGLGCGFGDRLQRGDHKAHSDIVGAVYEALRLSRTIRYDYEPANPGVNVQEVRLAGEILRTGVGTCLDLALLFAALLERAHLAPAILALDTGNGWHILGGYFIPGESPRSEVVIQNVEEILYLVNSGHLVVIEATGVAQIGGMKKPFSQACRDGLEALRNTIPLALVNVQVAREQGILPINGENLRTWHLDLEDNNRFPFFYVHQPSLPAFFVGRIEELTQLQQAAQEFTPSIVVVLGMGGQGKTTLVHQWLRQQESRQFSAGLWCTAYRGEFSFDMFLDEALRYLLEEKFDKRELPEVAVRSAKLIGLLQQRPILIVIDGIERWLTGWHRGRYDRETAETVEERTGYFTGLDDFLQVVSGLENGSHLILTTRAMPAVLDHVSHTTIPVHDEPDHDLALKGLDPDASVFLLRRLGVKGSDDKMKQVAATYAYHPLALTILGGLLSKKYGGRLEQIPQLSALDPKHALFKLLDDVRQNLPGGAAAEQLLRVASHCLENPSLMAIATVTPKFLGSLNDLLEQAVILADWNLVSWDGADQIVRLHPLVKQYFSGLADVAETKILHERFSAWYTEQSVPHDASSLEHVRPRLLAIEHALLAGNLTTCRKLCFIPIGIGAYPLFEWLAAWGHLETGLHLLDRLAEPASPLVRAEFLIPRAVLHHQRGALDSAQADLNEAIAALDSYGIRLSRKHRSRLAVALMNRANVHWQASRLTQALADYNRALKVLERFWFRDTNWREQTADIRMNRGIALREMGHYTEALHDCDQSLQMYRELVADGVQNLEPMLIAVLINHGNILADQRKPDVALQSFVEAIAICNTLIQSGHHELVPRLMHAQTTKAVVLKDLGRTKEALSELNVAVDTVQDLVNTGRSDMERLLALGWISRSEVSIRLQQWHAALNDCDRAIHWYRRMINRGRHDLTGRLAYALLTRAEARYTLGQVEEAAADRSQGFALMRQLIATGEKETRVGYFHKSITAATYLLASHPNDALVLLETAVTELEHGLLEGQAVEALRIEVQRGIESLSVPGIMPQQHRSFDSIIQRLRTYADNC